MRRPSPATTSISNSGTALAVLNGWRRGVAGQRFDRPARGSLRRGCRLTGGLAALAGLVAGCAPFDVAVGSVRGNLHCIVRYGHPVAVSHWETISPTPP